LIELPISTGDGLFIARYSDKGLAELYFPKSRSLAESPLANTNGGKIDKHAKIQILRWHKLTTAALKKVLLGSEPSELPPLDIKGTVFQKNVWKVMRTLPPGKTKSYGEVAKAVGKPKAVRAVGSACGANPLPVLVPCHRVLGAHGKIGGFGGGLHWKRTLLFREGVEFNGEVLIQPR
jgi:O-6-methylguanine DNA methyltransferase